MGVWGVLSGVGRRVAGVEAIRAGGNVLVDLGKKAASPVCPKCGQGRLSLRKSVPASDGHEARYRCCDSCDYQQPLTGATNAEFESLRDYTMERIDSMSDAEVAAILRTHKLSSRVFYSLSGMMCLYAFYMMLFGQVTGMFLSLSGFALMFLVFGIKSSYRHWQVSTGTLFEPGSFRRWWATGPWVV